MLSGISNNIGDQAIFAGFAKVFGEACDEAGIDVEVDVAFIYEMRIREAELAEINERYDAVILAGGGYIYHRPDDESASGWGFDIPEDMLARLRPKLAVYAAGYNYRAHAGDHFPERAAPHIRATFAKAAHFSVREHGSAAMLRERFGVEGPIDVVPDGAIHCEPVPCPVPMDSERYQVAVCLRLDALRERFLNFERFLTELCSALETLADDGAEIVYLPHLLTPTDALVISRLRQYVPLVSVSDRAPGLYSGAGPGVGEALMGLYSLMDVVIGQRLHSLVMPFARGVPVVSMTSTLSSLWMQRYFGVDDRYHLDVDTLTADSLVSAVRSALRHRAALSSHAVARSAELRVEGGRAIRGLVEAVL